MVTLEKITASELRPLVYKSYENDEELFEKYHVGKFSLRECVEKTIEMIEEMQKLKDLNYHKVLCDGVDIGYMVTYDTILYSFAIAMEYRNKKVLMEWWQKVNEVLGKEFYAMLYRNNTRATEFLKRQNMRVIIENVDEDYLVFSSN